VDDPPAHLPDKDLAPSDGDGGPEERARSGPVRGCENRGRLPLPAIVRSLVELNGILAGIADGQEIARECDRGGGDRTR